MYGAPADAPKATCSTCGATYVDWEDYSGPAHSQGECLRELSKRVLTAEKEATDAQRQLRRLHENIEAGIFVNATPDAEYPIRILEGHLAPNESTFVTDNLAGMSPTDPVLVEMNKASAERATILRAAIAALRLRSNDPGDGK